MNPEPNLQPRYFFSYPNLYSLLFPTNPELNFLTTVLHTPPPIPTFTLTNSLALSPPFYSSIL